jgi:hypothetical protein
MFLKKLKIVTVVLLAAVLGSAAVVALGDRQARGPGAPRILDLGSGQRGRYIAWSPDGKTLAVVTIHESFLFSSKRSALKLWDVEQGKVMQTVAEPKEKAAGIWHVVFSADGKTIASIVSETIQHPGGIMIQEVVKVWDAKTLALKQTLGGSSKLGTGFVSQISCPGFVTGWQAGGRGRPQ